MKQCLSCKSMWEPDARFCPLDGSNLDLVAHNRRTGPLRASADIKAASASFELAGEHYDFSQIKTGQTAELDLDRTNIKELAKNALGALECQRRRDQEVLQSNIELYDRFNDYCRAVQYFLDGLASQSDAFQFKASYEDQPRQMWACFTLMLGEGRYLRRFPITVRYLRKPRREVTLEINLYDIGLDRDSRLLRTEKLGGRARNLGQGYTYLLAAPGHQPRSALLSWLKESFNSILQLAYSD